MRRGLIGKGAVVAVGVAAVVCTTFGSAASASAAAAPVVKPVVVKVGMQVIGIDRQVAEAHGYKVVRGADGRDVPVPKSGFATPNAERTVYGNCGYSYVELTPRGGAAAYFRTGFHVNRGAVDYSWNVRIVDHGGVSNQGFGGALANRQDWTSGEKTLHLTRGYATATVVSASSFAIENNGAVCYSGGPGIGVVIT